MSDSIPRTLAGDLAVGVADLGVLAGPTGTISTRALGSCIGLTVFDPKVRVGGLLHYMLPQPRTKEEALQSPAMFAVTGLSTLFRSVLELGAMRERLIVCVAGASEMMDREGGFSIGRRNRLMLRKLLWKNGIPLQAEDTGGTEVRELSLELGTGRVQVRTRNEERVLWPR
ncbi:MAG: chemotaxis protein CheD [Planctomycetota bacterium]|nr:chemotaxis protein CheD [Planctomycetota bacterium]